MTLRSHTFYCLGDGVYEYTMIFIYRYTCVRIFISIDSVYCIKFSLLLRHYLRILILIATSKAWANRIQDRSELALGHLNARHVRSMAWLRIAVNILELSRVRWGRLGESAQLWVNHRCDRSVCLRHARGKASTSCPYCGCWKFRLGPPSISPFKDAAAMG